MHQGIYFKFINISSTKLKNPPNLTKDTLKSILNRSLFDCNQEPQANL